MSYSSDTYGLVAEYADTDTLIEAVKKLREAGYHRFNAYTPFPVHGLADALGFTRTGMPLVVLIGGVIGFLGGYGLQYWATVYYYPLNIGGRPLHSWPSFIPVTFETTVLCAALFAVLGMLALNGLPRPHHPLFEIPRFARASQDAFFLVVEARDPEFHETRTRELLMQLGATEVSHVPSV